MRLCCCFKSHEVELTYTPCARPSMDSASKSRRPAFCYCAWPTGPSAGPVRRRDGRVSASVIQTLFVYVHTATVSPQAAAARHCPPGHWQPALWPLSQPALCGGVPRGFLSLPYKRCLLLCTQQQNKSDIRDLLDDIRQY